MKTINLTSSHGVVKVDRESGAIVEIDAEDPDYLVEIDRFNTFDLCRVPDTWDTLDILYIGFWDKKGDHTPHTEEHLLPDEYYLIQALYTTDFGDVETVTSGGRVMYFPLQPLRIGHIPPDSIIHGQPIFSVAVYYDNNGVNYTFNKVVETPEILNLFIPKNPFEGMDLTFLTDEDSDS